MTTRIGDEVVFEADVKFPGGISTTFARTQLTSETATYAVPLISMRVHDAIQTNLPGTAASDDLAIVSAAFGTDGPSLRTSDADNTTVTQYARFQFVLPPEYVTAGTCTLRITGGMVTSVASSSATVDVEAYRADGDTSVGSDICATSAASINSLTSGSDDFTITPTTLAAGDTLDVRLTIAITDSGAGTACIGEIGAVEFLLQVRG